MGLRELDPGRRVFDAAAETLVIRTREPLVALEALAGRGVRRVLLEGGPTLAAAFLRAGAVDEVIVYLAPKFLGAGRSAVADLGVTTISEALEGDVTDICVLEGGRGEPPNVRITLSLREKSSAGQDEPVDEQVVEQGRGHHQEVPDLMEPEPARHGVRSFDDVDEEPQAVDDAAGPEQHHRPQR